MLLALINDILDFSRIEAGKLQIEAIDFDLEQGAVASDQVALRAQQRGAGALWFVTGAGVPRRLAARCACPRCWSTGQQRREVHRIWRDRGADRTARATGNRALEFCVRDTGMGIPADRLAQLFTPFTGGRLHHPALWRRRPGLAICRQLVELMGSTIAVQNQEGAGSQFSFTLPLAPAARGTRALPAMATPWHRATTACCAAVACCWWTTWSSTAPWPWPSGEAGVLVDVTGMAANAVDKGAGQPYDLVLMDIQMPEMDGLTATREIRQQAHLGACPSSP